MLCASSTAHIVMHVSATPALAQTTSVVLKFALQLWRQDPVHTKRRALLSRFIAAEKEHRHCFQEPEVDSSPGLSGSSEKAGDLEQRSYI